MVKRVIAVLLMVALFMSLMAATAFARQENFSFSVNTAYNGGNAWSAGNPKDDTEQKSYYVTQSTNATSTSEFYYATTTAASLDESLHVTAYTHITGTGTKTSSLYSKYCGKDKVLYLEADTDFATVSASGYWFS